MQVILFPIKFFVKIRRRFKKLFCVINKIKRLKNLLKRRFIFAFCNSVIFNQIFCRFILPFYAGKLLHSYHFNRRFCGIQPFYLNLYGYAFFKFVDMGNYSHSCTADRMEFFQRFGYRIQILAA